MAPVFQHEFVFHINHYLFKQVFQSICENTEFLSVNLGPQIECPGGGGGQKHQVVKKFRY